MDFYLLNDLLDIFQINLLRTNNIKFYIYHLSLLNILNFLLL